MNTNCTTEIFSSQIHHLAWLNWVKDGRPEGQDMDYWMAAETLLEDSQPVLAVKVKKQGGVKAPPAKRKSKRHVATSAGTSPV